MHIKMSSSVVNAKMEDGPYEASERQRAVALVGSSQRNFLEERSFKLRIKVGFICYYSLYRQKSVDKGIGEGNGWASVGAWGLFIWLKWRWKEMLERSAGPGDGSS